MNPTAILLLAHGARDERWADPFRVIQREVATRRPDAPVHLAFLEFMAPDLTQAAETALAAGARDLQVVPLFLGTGGHVRKDVPPMLEALRQAHPGISITLHPAIGSVDSVLQAMAAAAVTLTMAGEGSPEGAHP